MASTTPGNRPPDSAEIETPVTEPMVIGTRLGGMASVCARVAASRATRLPGLAPRGFISGNNTGTAAAMWEAFEPVICPTPDTSRRPARNAGHHAEAAYTDKENDQIDMPSGRSHSCADRVDSGASRNRQRSCDVERYLSNYLIQLSIKIFHNIPYANPTCAPTTTEVCP